jgi:alpha-glucosidase
MTFNDVSFAQITTHIRGGSIIPMRVKSADTTMEVRKQNFATIVAPGLDGTASGSLYLDDGDSLIQPAVSDSQFTYSAKGIFSMQGSFDSGVVIESVTVLGSESHKRRSDSTASYDSTARSLTHKVDLSLKKSATLNLLDT